MSYTPQILIDNKNNYPNEPALSVKQNNEWQTLSWSEYYDFVIKISKSLIACGIKPGDKGSIYSYNRKEWFGCYSALQMINSASVGVYHTSSAPEVEWVIGNSDSKIVFVGNNPNDNGDKEKMPIHRLISVIENLDQVVQIVLMGDDIERINHDKIVSWNEFIDQGASIDENTIFDLMKTIKPVDTSSLIYTSGTTGNPKGVELTNRNFEVELDSVAEVLKYNQGEKYVSWLPLAHVFGQLVDNHYWVRRALHMHIVDNPLNTVDYAKEVQPHLFVSVPRIYEKIYSNLKAAIDTKAILKIGLKIPLLSNIFKKKLKEAAGFSNSRFAISGAAPINPEILKLFQNLDIPLFEGYGMTENTAGITINYQGNNKIGSVGKCMPFFNIKIADDGEILIQGDNVMKGYYKNPEATSETIVDGWLHTGDVGAIDSDGYLSITGRKKEIYVSSSGKNVAPLVIEETMKSIPIISQCFLVGDGRKYCSALVTLDMSVILRDKIGIDTNKIPKDPSEQNQMIIDNGKSLSDFTDSEKVHSEISAEINRLNLNFSNPEQIKKFSILPRDFSIDDGELTPTLKVKRKVVDEKYAELIDSLYQV
ncbi:MAG TPA: AMP-dependent synthetase/ligase [Candidatus Marinimicrobia bacterium]|jgi:long-chain acyl-CoA synthetase|nr:AMP-dependent synthetase/ligase [Candidatus Neomarinimicrobiota bacterium]HJM69911.1 AMP-dependent synthetase/ligase [Candidatus Neomarinimicrobiota bacterium]|tara:strand:+ start:11310 stop:13088 length:1779 start_codon:yes stop_codon:yes gene_type:complete